MEFCTFDKKYVKIDCNAQLKDITLMDLYQDYYGIRRLPDKVKYFKEPKLSDYPINLNADTSGGYRLRDNLIMYGSPLSKVLLWSIKQDDNIGGEAIKVFTHRKSLVSIMSAVYGPSNNYKSPCLDWRIYATKYKNNLYLYCENDENLKQQNMYSSFHHTLENILFCDFGSTGRNDQKPIDENIRLAGVYRATLNKYHLIYSCELQGIQSDVAIGNLSDPNVINSCRFINTKVSTKPNITGPWLLNKYLQNILAKTDTTYVAVRDKNGFVRDPIKQLDTAEMPKRRYWEPKICQQFLFDFLEMVMDKMSMVNSLETTYVFNYVSEAMKIFYDIHEGRTDKTFLSDKYMETITKLGESSG